MPSSSRDTPRPPEAPRRPRTTVLGAFLEGWRRAVRAPYLVAGILLATIVVSLPTAGLLYGAIEDHLGSSLMADEAVRGWPTEWAAEFSSGQTGVGATLTHEILGFGGTLATLSRLADATPLPPALVGTVGAYLVLWIFLSGGVIDRLARARTLGSTMFLATCGRFFFRLLRLGAIAGAGYWVLFRWLHPLFFTTGLIWAFDEREPETHAMTWRIGFYVLFLVLLGLFTLVVDVARVRLVVEDRRSVVAAIGAGFRFVRRRPGRMVWLFLLHVIGQAVLARLWMQIAPGASSATWVVLLVAQVYLVTRIWARLAFVASEVVFFQGELAHATYTAPAPPLWPDSASIEALRHLRRDADDGPIAGLG